MMQLLERHRAKVEAEREQERLEVRARLEAALAPYVDPEGDGEDGAVPPRRPLLRRARPITVERDVDGGDSVHPPR